MTANLFGAGMPHPPIMVRDVGGNRAEVTRASIDAADQVRDALANFDPEVLVVMSPHAPLVSDGFAIDDSESLEGSLAQFGDARTYSWQGDPAFAHLILQRLSAASVPAIPRSGDGRLQPGVLDHAVLVPLSFIDPAQRRPLVVISLSFLDYAHHRTLGAVVREAALQSGKRVAFIASGDLSHRLTPDAPAGYSPRAPALDAAIVSLVERGLFSELSRIDQGLVEAGGECGLRSLIALGGFLGDDPVATRVLAYEGPWGVGYMTVLAGDAAIAAYDDRALTRSTPETGAKGGSPGSDDSEVVRLARSAIEHWVGDGATLAEPTLDTPEYPDRAGAFVSLHIAGQLRGCIGTIAPTQPTLADEVAYNAVQAAAHDPRFPPVGYAELDLLDIKVDVLQPAEACRIDDLDPSKYGVIVTSGMRRGLLLPDLEGVDDVRDQVAIAMQKAGIQPGEACGYERFRVDRYT